MASRVTGCPRCCIVLASSGMFCSRICPRYSLMEMSSRNAADFMRRRNSGLTSIVIRVRLAFCPVLSLLPRSSFLCAMIVLLHLLCFRSVHYSIARVSCQGYSLIVMAPKCQGYLLFLRTRFQLFLQIVSNEANTQTFVSTRFFQMNRCVLNNSGGLFCSNASHES